ncbi:MAG: iron-sulfur cluster repair di-iron protein [Clostridium perfringens]|uniref:Iron-sulfur cluster repair di-iron protein n=1 Tax=Clostridium perfringens TaxID=1502 RepID=A0AAW4IUR7_CLOPF|nr:iron-sulfur cluster repair di-iron protein [Clostridium perfringens]EHP50262.1 iron-sulfur cluster repair di-iron protein [Clostridium perfringens WAL-14572]MBO3354529.1 iron-sulfur cluster repair di-iron protein [Clostridium perfringens]MBO3357799.1 iron-sulfur cluster repair di-iron protein [Clostridium perfringens]MDU1255948.1 iron-sulfur cluster repair di-iron protein [Clostridium perfringens]MDU2318697.1 iron-sulfur cluster repair di-iron protein [Clostridium perfringens]
MEKLIRKDYSLGEVVTVYPAVVKKFNDMELDYCCGGSKSLEVALKEKGVDVDKFVEDLNKEFKEFKFENSQYVDWREKSSEELINHIVEIHHAETFRLLKEIDPLMVKVFRVHFSHDPELLMKVHSLFGKLKCELEEHLLKEENILFPLMIKYDQAKDEKEKKEIEEDIRIIVNEHEAAGDILKELAEVTDDYKVQEWGCISFKLLYDYLHDLEKDLFIHIHKENNILFPRY